MRERSTRAVGTATVTGMVELLHEHQPAEVFLRQWGDSDGSPVLALHQLGIAGSSVHLAGLGLGLAETYDLRVLAPDLPGFGGSKPWPAERYRPSELAGLLLSLLDRLALVRVCVVGLSWGATLGCHLAALAPERVSALVLLDAGHIDPSDAPGFEAQAKLRDRVRAAGRSIEAFRFRTLDEALNAVSDDYPDWTPELEASWTTGLRLHRSRVVPRLRPSTYGGSVQGLVDEPVSATWPALAASAVPVLLLTADEPESAREVQALGRAQFAAAVPQAEVRILTGQRNDLVAGLGPALVPMVGDWLVAQRGFGG
jgi:pimeloyl-ACP methyl ester carboxylesterase